MAAPEPTVGAELLHVCGINLYLDWNVQDGKEQELYIQESLVSSFFREINYMD